MKRTAGALVLLAAVGGCVSSDNGPNVAMGPSTCPGGACSGPAPRSVAGAVGPWGQPVTAMYSDTSKPMTGAEYAKATIAGTMMPPDQMIQRAQYMQAGSPPGGGPSHVAMGPPPGSVPPGNMTLPPNLAGMPPGAAHGPAPFLAQRTEVRFLAPAGMKVAWFAPSPASKNGFTAQALDVPGRYNFVQGAIYRLKLTDVPNREGIPYFPTLEVVPTNIKTAGFLAHSSVPVSFTAEDFEQVAAGNYLVKVIYLPDPQFQDLAATGPNEVVSSRLEPGVDPIAEACRRGSILLVVRLGNIDLEAAGSPAMDAPSPYHAQQMPNPAATRGGMMGPHGQVLPPTGPGAPNSLPNSLAPQNLPPALPGAATPAPLPPVIGSPSSKAPSTGSLTPAALASQPGAAPPATAKKKSWWSDLPPDAN
jgi:hypothetical protein